VVGIMRRRGAASLGCFGEAKRGRFASALLPHEGDQAPRHLVLVFRAARQLFRQKLFLIEQSPDERGHHEGEDGQSTP